MTYFLNLLNNIKGELSELENYFIGKNKAAEILGVTQKKAAFNFNFDDNCYEILDDSDPDALIDKIMQNKMGASTFTKADRKEENLPKLKEGSIAKRNDGRWQGRYYDNGYRKYLYASTKKEIILKMNKAILERNKKNKANTISKNITLNKWIIKWLELKQDDITEATLRNYNIHLVKKIAANPIGKKQVKFISAFDIQKFIKTIDAPSSKARTFRHLKSCFLSLAQNKVISDNPFDVIKNISEPHNKKFVPTKEQLNGFFKYLKKAYYEIYLFAKFIALTGVRKGEALALTWDDIKQDRIFIDKAWEQSANKIQAPKTKASIRSIPIFPGVKELLDTFPHDSEEVFSFIFKSSVGHRFHHHVVKHGIEGLTLHSLRHYFATQCLEIGINDKVVQKWLGHGKLSVTKDTYQHVKTDFETTELEKMAKSSYIKE